ncbi:MAG: LEA type 2 family protein [Myxococcaceae bacterium]|nr:LEA type 2 family protein [Myxococcaceae bacterium]
MKTIKFAVAVAALAFAGCRSAPPAAPEAPPPELVSQDLDVTQSLTSFKLSVNGEVKSEAAATVEQAKWEMVVEGKVVKSGEMPLNVAIPAGGTAPFSVHAEGQYVSSPEELKALSDNGGSILTALRGDLIVKTASGKTVTVPFARSRDIRTPRLPRVTMHELDAARYSDREANIFFRIGVVNPNPFPLRIGALDFKAEVAGKQVAEGTRGQGDTIDAAATGIYEVQQSVNEETHGPDIKKLIKGQLLPWRITGVLKGELFEVPVNLEGTVKLNVSQ